MLAKPQDLMDSHVKNSEVVLLFRVLSGNELKDAFEEQCQMVNNKEIVEIRAFNLKSLLCDSKRNNRIKSSTNKATVFHNWYYYLSGKV